MQRGFKPWLNALQNYAISALNLSVGLQMRHRCQIKPDFGTAAKLRQLTDGKICAVVSDNAVRDAVPGCYLDDELRSCSSVKFFDGFCFHPLCEFVGRATSR